MLLESHPKNFVLPDPKSKCCTYDYYYGILQGIILVITRDNFRIAPPTQRKVSKMNLFDEFNSIKNDK